MFVCSYSFTFVQNQFFKENTIDLVQHIVA